MHRVPHVPKGHGPCLHFPKHSYPSFRVMRRFRVYTLVAILHGFTARLLVYLGGASEIAARHSETEKKRTMSLWEALTGTISNSILCSWIGALIACPPTLIASLFASSQLRRKRYLNAGFLGGGAGEEIGVVLAYIAIWHDCRGHHCNTAEEKLVLLFTVPAGSILGCLSALTYVYYSSYGMDE